MDIKLNSARISRQKTTQKSFPIPEYNKGKRGVDISDQMGSYATTLRRGIKWYWKLAIEYVLGIF